MRRSMCLLLCLVLLMTGWTASFAKATEVESAPLIKASTRNGMVRVYLSSMGNPTSLDITVAGSYTADGPYDMPLTNGETVNIAFNKSNGQITMNRGGVAYAMGQEMSFRRHQATGSNGLRIAQTRMPENLYPGDLYLKAQQTGGTWRLYAIVHVYIEYYLYGVVPYEMGNSANIEALKAQAVAARTYTLNKMNIRSGSLYDVVDTTNDQVYYGNSDTTLNCTAALDATRGIVVMNDGELTGTYYTASNGGQTESAANGFNSKGYGYLGIKDDPFDLMNSASVKRSVTVYADNTSSSQNSTIRSLLNSKAQMVYGSSAAVTRIHSITPHTPMYASPSRLYTKLDFDVTVQNIHGTTDATLTLDIFSDLEKALGMSINGKQNELWTVEDYGSSFKLVSRRFGHGVGMSQRGAMQMGSMGYTYDQILGFYYENCRRVQYSFTHTVLSSIESGGTDTITSTEAPAEITIGSGSTAAVKLSGVMDRLAIRNGASGNAAVLTSVVNGSLMTVLAKGSDWTLVKLGQIVGYVPTSALKFSGTPPTSSNEVPSSISQWATVQCQGTLNLRTSPSLSAGVQASIPNGAVLCVFQTQEGWAKVQYGASVGWASMDFLKLSNVYPGQTSGEGTTYATVRIPSGSGTVNMRATASTTSRVLMTITHGQGVTVLANDGSWCYAQYNGQEGYIMTKYLSLGEKPEEAPPAETPSLGDGEMEAIVKTASGTLNLRERPDTASRVLMTLPRGESIIVTNRGTEWCSVRYAGISGYVMSKYLSFPADNQAAPVSYAIVATQSGPLNMRKQPTTGSSVVTQIPKGSRVGVIETVNGWSRVNYNGATGYVMASYLRQEGGSTPEPVQPYAKVTTSGGGLNLRETASADAKVLLSIPNGTVLEVLDAANGWVKVKHQSLIGYVMNRYVTFTSDAPSTPPPVVETPGSGVTVKTGGGSLNLRRTANLTAQVVTIIPDGAAVKLLTRYSEWCQVSYNGYTGYVMTKYLNINEDEERTPPHAWVNTSGGGLNLRETASADARVLLSIPQGEKVELHILGTAWCKVTYNGTTGYVMTKYLDFQEPVASGGAWFVLTSGGGLNLRETASADARVLLSIPNGTAVTMLEQGSDWCKIQYNESIGYVMTKYLSRE